MPLPSTPFGVLAIIVLLLPGFVFVLARRQIRGFRPDDRAVSAQVLQALVISIFADALYIVLLWGWFVSLISVEDNTVLVRDPAGLGWAILACGFAAPALAAVIIYFPYRFVRTDADADGDIEAGDQSRLRVLGWTLKRRHYYSTVPTAWDRGVAQAGPRLVRVRLPDGSYVGGIYSAGSYVSTYPEPHDMYISQTYEMSAEGAFGAQIEEGSALWLSIGADHLVEFFPVPSDAVIETKEQSRG